VNLEQSAITVVRGIKQMYLLCGSCKQGSSKGKLMVEPSVISRLLIERFYILRHTCLGAIWCTAKV